MVDWGLEVGGGGTRGARRSIRVAMGMKLSVAALMEGPCGY